MSLLATEFRGVEMVRVSIKLTDYYETPLGTTRSSVDVPAPHFH